MLIAVVFAGCAANGDAADVPAGSVEPQANDPIQPGDVDPNSPFGVVQGAVLNDEQIPIPGALVGLRETSFQSVTDANGNFLLRDVSPGSYALDVGALGFETQAREITVAAGQITSVSVLLVEISIVSEVYYEIIPHSGYLECALSTAAWISGCSYPYTMAVGGIKDGTCYWGPYLGLPIPCVPPTGVDLWAMGAPRDFQNNAYRFNISIPQNIGQLQAELVWTPSSAAAVHMNLIIVCGDYDWIADDCVNALRYGKGDGVNGPSPVKNVIEREDWEGGLGFYTNDSRAQNNKYDLKANPEGIWVTNYVGLPFGCLDVPTNCMDGLPYNEFQLAFGQRFDLYDTLFINGRGPDDWTVLVDG
ncbi:MAG TPA: carboxypeptidase-like regulatory domain-containing protein [Candidatus Thermoplasmatota archaeon]